MPHSDHSVLIVDDDVDVRETLGEFLSAEGYSVVIARDGAEALSLLRSGAVTPCVILLDLMMPVMNGYQFRQNQKRDERLAEIPVFVLSAGDRLDEEALEPTVVVKKPFDIDLLLTELRRHC